MSATARWRSDAAKKKVWLPRALHSRLAAAPSMVQQERRAVCSQLSSLQEQPPGAAWLPLATNSCERPLARCCAALSAPQALMQWSWLQAEMVRRCNASHCVSSAQHASPHCRTEATSLLKPAHLLQNSAAPGTLRDTQWRPPQGTPKMLPCHSRLWLLASHQPVSDRPQCPNASTPAVPEACQTKCPLQGYHCQDSYLQGFVLHHCGQSAPPVLLNAAMIAHSAAAWSTAVQLAPHSRQSCCHAQSHLGWRLAQLGQGMRQCARRGLT
mmetsp:Transcript_22957/g.44100  ORF Transcript_22957/g.44100 Transcript_22957/m.44100 type:complete len:269 (+) Transcript_22957:478-1284(+)